MIVLNGIFLALQSVPPPVPPPPPPGLPINKGIGVLFIVAILYGSYLLWIKRREMKAAQSPKEISESFTICAFHGNKPNRKSKKMIAKSIKKLKKSFFLFVLFVTTLQALHAQVMNDQFQYSKSLNIEQSNSWAVGAGVSNFIMHGDLRSIGTGDLGNFWNFGGYVYVDNMFNPVLGLELKLNYNNISGGAQYFSDIYEVLYINNTNITNNLFFEGRSFGVELNMIFSFSNLFIQNSRKWHMAGYFGIGYHQYNSVLFEQNSDGSITELVDFGLNPTRNNVNEASSIFLSVQFGIKYRLNKRIDLEFRPSWYFNNEDHLDATISNKQDWETFFVNHLGVTVKLGKKKIYTIWGDEDNDTSKSISFTIIDTDGDGVMDQLDKEPNTPKGVKVYGDGVAVDADKDGIPDHEDKCPINPGLIENGGCPTIGDADNDGVLDHEDLCPTKAGPAENKGCPEVNDEASVIKYISDLATNVYFDTGKWTLTKNSTKVLDRVARYMVEELPDMKFKIEGHTDNRDRDEFNLYLSQKRADAVMKYLRKKGVHGSRLVFKGYGETRPIYSNTTEEGRQLNRRVEIKPQSSFDYNPIDNDLQSNNISSTHTVSVGETLFSIAKKYGITIKRIKELNNLKEEALYVGQKLKIKE
jgi:outer membrane protein OmpA-like peptidoglycan-associated protein